MVEPIALLGASIAIGLAALGGGIGVGLAGAASAGAIAERPEAFGRTVVYVAFAEACAIYGLLIAILIVFGIGGH
ncbi:MAG TPA: hypothetical protein EYP86_04780 [Candidatus Altiarchaeales archaeon]|nr:hypothetical protein [Candidatus Altiarchaeales archaeon]